MKIDIICCVPVQILYLGKKVVPEIKVHWKVFVRACSKMSVANLVSVL